MTLATVVKLKIYELKVCRFIGALNKFNGILQIEKLNGKQIK